MAKTNDEIMDDVAADLLRCVESDNLPLALMGGAKKWGDGLWKHVAMTEAHQRGDDLLQTRLSIMPGDIESVPKGDLIERVSRATIYATDWQKSREAGLAAA